MVGFFRGEGLRAPMCTQRVAPRSQKNTRTGALRLGRPVAISRLDAGPPPLPLGRESVQGVSASPLLLRSGARGDSPSARITSPPCPPLARRWGGLSCATLWVGALGQP